MDYYQKVIWSEGLFLTPQHFQQWDRYQEGLLERRLRAVLPLGWGISDLRIDEDALTNGELILARLKAVVAGGLHIDIPDLDASPPARHVGESFTPGSETLGVYVGAPRARPGRAACGIEDGSSERATRYLGRHVTVVDDSSGSGERQIACAVKNLSLLLEGEPLEDHDCLKIAEIERTATGTFALREAYVPPCLSIAASPLLMKILRRVVEILSTKSTDLAKQRRQRVQGLVEFTMSEAANFWFLHTINGFIPALMHFHRQPQVHPELLYLEVARLVGELYTFGGEGHPKDVPPYVHDDLSSTFVDLEAKLRLLLETVIPTRCTPVPLERTKESLFTGRVHDEQLLEKAQFYLAVMANVPEEKIVREVPLKAKISSLDRVDRLIAQALRGVGLKHLPTPPAEIPVQPGRTYFQLDKRGEHWDGVKSSRTISIYLPPEFAGLKLELMAVKE